MITRGKMAGHTQNDIWGYTDITTLKFGEVESWDLGLQSDYTHHITQTTENCVRVSYMKATSRNTLHEMAIHRER